MLDALTRLLDGGRSGPVPDWARASVTAAAAALAEGEVYPASLALGRDGLFFLFRRSGTKELAAVTPAPAHDFEGIVREVEAEGRRLYLLTGPRSHINLEALQAQFPHLRPAPLGLKKSWGFGDRLGLATPGHVRAVERTGIAPVFAQQSPREIQRTDRTAQEVMDAAVWGVFQAGWHKAFGADADHLKTPEHVDEYAAAGYTLYTLDPSDHVDDEADAADVSALRLKLERLPWDRLRTNWNALQSRYLGRTWRIEDHVALTLTEKSLARAAVKYGAALSHTAELAAYTGARMGARPFELEVSVDETQTATTPEEHFFVTLELQRLRLEWVGLAPRFAGRFEKGVDYMGDLREFEQQLAAHAAIARHVGPYKLSIHSGSDKFRIYGIAAKHAKDLLHVKTAGTSYLEALRAVAQAEPSLFREILAYALKRFDADKATYYTSASPGKVPPLSSLGNEQLADLLDDFDARQILHIAFGSVLAGKDDYGQYLFRKDLMRVLNANEERYYDALEEHLKRHLEPFV